MRLDSRTVSRQVMDLITRYYYLPESRVVGCIIDGASKRGCRVHARACQRIPLKTSSVSQTRLIIFTCERVEMVVLYSSRSPL